MYTELIETQALNAELVEALEMLMPQAPNDLSADSYDLAMWRNAQEVLERTKTSSAGRVATSNACPDGASKLPAEDPFTADNITIYAIDVCAFVTHEAAEVVEQTWKDSMYGVITPAEAAEKMNHQLVRLQLAFTP